MKRVVIVLLTSIAVIAVGFIVFRQVARNRQAKLLDDLKIETIERGSLSTIVEANGTVRSNQSALLVWEIPGEVEYVNVTAGDQVFAGDVLTSLETTSLPSYIILAQTDLVSAQKDLDNLLNSEIQRAQALKAVDEAQKALEDAHNPELAQAQALAAIAEAEEAVEDAQQQYDILTTSPPQSAIDQAYANLLLAEDRLNQTLDDIEQLEWKIKTIGAGLPPSIQKTLKQSLKKTLEGLQMKQTQDQLAYEKSLARYNSLLAPPDLVDVSVAEAELATAKAQLEDAQRGWGRIKDGPSPAEIAVLEAKLEDAQREWERVKDGPNPDDIMVLKTYIAAAQATINQMNVTVPFDGIITEVATQPGDQITSGTLAFRLDDVSHLVVDLGVSEIDINQIRVGQKVTVTLDAVPAKEYQGEVVEVATVGTELLGVVNFKVTVELLGVDDAIKPGMTSTVKIVINQVDDVLLAPNQAIRVLDGRRVVYVLEDTLISSKFLSRGLGQSTRKDILLPRGIQPVPITVGAISSAYSEIISGDLQAGDQIVLNPSQFFDQ